MRLFRMTLACSSRWLMSNNKQMWIIQNVARFLCETVLYEAVCVMYRQPQGKQLRLIPASNSDACQGLLIYFCSIFFRYFFDAFSLRCTSRGVTNISCLSPVTGGTVCQHRHVVEAETVRSTVSSRDLLALS